MKELKFIHIPRNAGTSIELIGKRNNILWGQFDNELKENKTDLNISYWHTPLYNFDYNFLLNYSNKYNLFAVVRNPYEKCISEYYFYKKWNNTEEQNEKELNSYIMKNLIDKNNITNDGHFIPQYKYFFDKNMNLIINHIIKFENIDNEFNELMKLYNLNINIKNFIINKSIKQFNINNLYKETIDKINSYYHIDFLMFNYTKI